MATTHVETDTTTRPGAICTWRPGDPVRRRSSCTARSRPARRNGRPSDRLRMRGFPPPRPRPPRLRTQPLGARRGLLARRRRHHRAHGRRRPSGRPLLRRPRRHVRRGPPPRSDAIADAARARRADLGPGPAGRGRSCTRSAVAGRRCPGRGVGRQLPEGGGSDPDEFPPEFLAAAVPLVPVFRRGRPVWDAGCRWPSSPRPRSRSSSSPAATSAGFDAMCDDLAERIGASRTVVEGAGHEIQFTGPPINEELLALWRGGGCSARGVMTVGAAAGRRGTRGAAVPRLPLVTRRTEVSRCP